MPNESLIRYASVSRPLLRVYQVSFDTDDAQIRYASVSLFCLYTRPTGPHGCQALVKFSKVGTLVQIQTIDLEYPSTYLDYSLLTFAPLRRSPRLKSQYPSTYLGYKATIDFQRFRICKTGRSKRPRSCTALTHSCTALRDHQEHTQIRENVYPTSTGRSKRPRSCTVIRDHQGRPGPQP